MTGELVSCIVPVRNGAPYLRAALDSITQQTYRPLEVIVVDDESTDDTPVIAACCEGVRYLWQAQAGPAAARNRGVQAAHGAFVAFLDVDDLWHPEKLARQMARFECRPDLDLCVTHLRNFCTGLSEQEARQHGHIVGTPLPGYVTVTMMTRRAVFERVGLFNGALPQCEDTEWMLRALDVGVVTDLLPDVLTYRRLHHDNMTRRITPVRRNDLLAQIVKAHLDRRRRGRTN